MTKRYIKLFDEHGRSLKSIELEPRVVSALPVEGERLGEMVHNLDDGRTYVWDGSRWQQFAPARIPHVRSEVLAQFTDPKLLICTSSMNEVLNSADKVEYQAGNITANSQELTIVGGSASTGGDSWVYWNLPDTATKAYARLQMNDVNAELLSLDFCNADASTSVNPPDFYNVCYRGLPAPFDFRLEKSVGGSTTLLGVQAAVMDADTYYELEFYVDTVAQALEVWRDNAKIFSVSDTDISQIAAVRVRCYDSSTSEAQSGKFKGPLVVIYE